MGDMEPIVTFKPVLEKDVKLLEKDVKLSVAFGDKRCLFYWRH